MATKSQWAERIAYALNEPLNVPLKENIKFSLDGWRAMFIRRDVQANGLSESFLQRFDIELVKVDKADACNFNLDCTKILRSKNPVPRPVRLKNDVLFKFVGDISGKPFTPVEYEEVPYTCYNKYTSKVIRYNYTNDYLYFFNNTKLKYARIQCIVENPADINSLCTDATCWNDLTSEYPLPLDMMPQIIEGILKGEFKILNPQNQEVAINKTIENT